MNKKVLFSSLILLALFLMSSCSREKTSFNDNHSGIYGKWILEGGSGGFSGNSFDPYFDYMIIDGNEKFTIYKDGGVISRGKINIIEQTNSNLKVSFNKRSGEDCFGYFNKNVRLESGELYLSGADCADCSSLHFVKADSYNNDDYVRDSKQIADLEVTKYDIGFDGRYTSICFVNENLGFIGCYDGSILKTENGGETWVENRSANNIPVYDIFFLNESIGFAGVGKTYGDASSGLLKTYDGGNTWAKEYVYPNIPSIQKIDFFNENDGLVIGDGAIHITHDSGMSWEEIATQFSRTFLDIFILDENTLFLSQPWSNVFWKSSDKCETWEEIGLQESLNINSIQFLSENLGFFGTNEIYKTEDGGFTWTLFEDVFSDINALYFQDGNNGVVFCTRLYIYDGDVAWKTDFNLLSNNEWYGDERIRDVELTFSLDSQTFFAVNKMGEFIVIKLSN